jgi:hypothetical protein
MRECSTVSSLLARCCLRPALDGPARAGRPTHAHGHTIHALHSGEWGAGSRSAAGAESAALSTTCLRVHASGSAYTLARRPAPTKSLRKTNNSTHHLLRLLIAPKSSDPERASSVPARTRSRCFAPDAPLIPTTLAAALLPPLLRSVHARPPSPRLRAPHTSARGGGGARGSRWRLARRREK